jgi:hypothetical protein
VFGLNGRPKPFRDFDFDAKDRPMPQFLMILHDTPGQFTHLSPTEIQAVLEKYGAWTGKLAAAGKLVTGRKLKDEGGKWVTKGAKGVSVVDGPYAETKEAVGGFFILKSETYDDVLKLIADCPHLEFGRIEVREIDFMGRPEE